MKSLVNVLFSDRFYQSLQRTIAKGKIEALIYWPF